MSDVHQIITLGIGTPSDVRHLLTFGLSIGAAPAIDPTADVIVRARPNDYVVRVPPADAVEKA